MSKLSKKYDVFISYASHDRAFAERIAEELKSKGHQIWYDDWEVLVGHDVVDRVYEGIRDSRFLLVLLSEKSVKSRWVQQEINAARIREIESGATIVLPVIIEANAKQLIPESLKTKRYADAAANFKSALSEIEYAISVMKISPPSFSSSVGGLDLEKQYTQTTEIDINSNGWRQNEAFREILVMPESFRLHLKNQDLERIIDSSTIRIRGYGGAVFPYDRSYSQVKEIHHADGFGVADNSTWPYEDWSFYYWYFTNTGFFLQRSHLSEDHVQNFPPKTLALEWLNLNVARSLLFARKLQSLVADYGEARIFLRLHGMKERRLVIFNKARSDFSRDYTSNDNEIEIRTILGPKTDLIQTGLEIVLDIVWRFGWRTPSQDDLRRDMETLCAAVFPTETNYVLP